MELILCRLRNWGNQKGRVVATILGDFDPGWVRFDSALESEVGRNSLRRYARTEIPTVWV